MRKTPILTDLMNQIINKGIIAAATAENDNVTVEKFFPANVEDVMSVSKKLIEKNIRAYKELAK